MRTTTLLLLLLIMVATPAAAQLKYPWAGGFNAVHACSIDLDLDGEEDLLLFDRHGNRKVTLLRRGAGTSAQWEPETSFAASLPDLHDWVITADYDRDGRMDIFTYGNGGIRVFRNVSDTVLRFAGLTSALTSWYYTSKIGILVTTVDYPAIADVDGDGDTDLLTFFGLGSFVEYHRNLSMERYGTPDSLDFRLEDPCWGRFRESEGGARITLGADCRKAAGIDAPLSGSKHTGSTMVATDLNGDGLTDLLLGDIDHPHLTALYNGGTVDTALMVSIDTLYPFADHPFSMFDFPVASHIDLNFDGVRDLLISSFNPTTEIAENYNCMWYYRNDGVENHPRFSFVTNRFFRDETMDFGSASHPVFADLDGDGADEMVVGSFGYYDTTYYKNGQLRSEFVGRIALFKNTGTTEDPRWECLTDDLAGLSSLRLNALYPAVAQPGGDGFPDLVVGCRDGSLICLPGREPVAGIPQFGPPEKNWLQIDVGEFSTPQFFDLDEDGIQELIVGERAGNLNLFRQGDPPATPRYLFVTDSLGGVNVTNPVLSWEGHSTPCFFHDSSGEVLLATGSYEGRIRFFGNTAVPAGAPFTELTALVGSIPLHPADTLIGWLSSPAVRIAPDGNPEVIAGNLAGGLNYLGRRQPPLIIPGIANPSHPEELRLSLFPNPASGHTTVHAPGFSGELRITNLAGQLLLSIPIHDRMLLRTGDLPAGLYIVKAGPRAARLVIL